jgi:hypothetical protein
MSAAATIILRRLFPNKAAIAELFAAAILAIADAADSLRVNRWVRQGDPTNNN